MTLEQRVKAALGEYQLQMLGLVQQLEDAQNQIADLKKQLAAQDKPAED